MVHTSLNVRVCVWEWAHEQSFKGPGVYMVLYLLEGMNWTMGLVGLDNLSELTVRSYDERSPNTLGLGVG